MEKSVSPNRRKSIKSCHKKRICNIFVVFQSVSCLLSGIFCVFLFPLVFNAVLQQMLTIKEGSPAFDAWKKPSIPTKLKFYFFSVKNPLGVQEGNPPDLLEVGPFTYRETLERIGTFHPENSTVTYLTKKEWFFIPEESLSLETQITTIDLPVLATAEFARGSYWSELSISGMMAMRSGLFTTRPARELLFEGYSDPLLTMGSMFAKDTGIPMDKFGWFYKRNGTTWGDGLVNMDTGESDFSEVGKIKTWHGKKRTLYSDECGEVRGTAAGFTAPDPDKQWIDYFSTDICRPIRFQREEGEVYVEGVEGRRFSLVAKETFGNMTTNPENHCYNANLPAGVHNSTGCKGGDTTLSTFVSLPHFLGADGFYADQFTEGSIRPDPNKHSASMTLQMETSIPIQVLMRLQIILQIRPNKNIGGFFKDLPEVFLPIFWFDAVAQLDPETALEVNSIPRIPVMAEIFGIVCFILGIIFVGIFAFLQIQEMRKLKNKTNIIEKDSVDIDVNMKSLTLGSTVL